MYFKPIDEMSLRQLFSTDFAKSQLQLAYIHPVLNSSGGIETSPDGLVLDMRRPPYKLRRCEFKYVPQGSSDFSHNGKFDLAVIWDFGSATNKQKLSEELLAQNGCFEIIALSEFRAFSSLPSFDYHYFDNGRISDDIKRMLIRREFHYVVVAYIAAKVYPAHLSIDKLKRYLIDSHQSVAGMNDQGRGNVVSVLMQTKPPLIKHMNSNNYCWNGDFDPVVSASSIAALIRENFAKTPPSDEDIKEILQR